MPFDPQKYFTNRISNENLTLGGSQKFHELQKASLDKAEALEESRLAKIAKAEAEQKLDDESLVGRLQNWGLMHEDTLSAPLLNLQASGFAGASRLAGNVVSAPVTIVTAMLDSGVTDEIKAARARDIEGQATPQDIELLLSEYKDPSKDPSKMTQIERVDRAYREKKGLAGTGQTNLDRIENLEAAADLGKKIRDLFDFSGLVHRGEQRRMEEVAREEFQRGSESFSKGWEAIKSGDATGSADMAEGVANWLMGIGKTMAESPQGSLELVTEQLPQILAAATGPAGMTISNATYAIDVFGKGIDEYRKQNNGAFPPDEKMWQMARWAGAAGISEYVGDKLTLGGGKKILGALDDVVKDVGEITTKSFKKTLMEASKATGKLISQNVVGRAAGGALRAGPGEFATETFQTFAEGKVEDKDVSAEDMYVAGTFGAIAGGTFGAVAGAVSPGPAREPKKEKEPAPVTESRKKVQEEAIKTGDVSSLVDPKSSTYAPERAIAALQAHSQLETTAPEVKAENLTKATQIVDELKQERRKAELALQMKTPEGLDAQIAEVKDTDPEFAAALERQKALIQERGIDKDAVRKAELALTKIDRHLTAAQENLDTFRQESVRTEEVEPLVQELRAAAPEQAEVSASRIINLAMVAPEKFTAGEATRIANDAALALSDAQRDFLRKLDSAQVAANRLKDIELVSKDILSGGEGFKGISQYQRDVLAALQTNNKKNAEYELAQLSKFARDHEAKARLVEKARKGQQVIKLADGNWAYAKTQLSDQEVADNGGLTVNTPKLGVAIRAEADALNSATQSLKAAYELKFPSKQGETNVPDQARSQGAQGQAGESQVPAAAAKGSKRDSANEGAADAASPAKDQKPVVESQPDVDRYIYLRDSVADLKDRLSRASDTRNRAGHRKAVDPAEVTKLKQTLADEEKNLNALLEKGGEPLKAAIEERKQAQSAAARKNTGLGSQLESKDETQNIYEQTLADVQKITDVAKLEKMALAKEKKAERYANNKAAGRLYSTIMAEAGAVRARIRQLTEQPTQSTEKTEAPVGAAVKSNQDSTQESQNQSNEDTTAAQQIETTEQSPEAQQSETTEGSTFAEAGNPPQETQVSSQGKLSVFSKRIEVAAKDLAKQFSQLNLVAQFFDQKAESDQYTSNRPLASVKNFLTAWNQDPALAQKYVSLDTEGDREWAALANLKAFLNTWVNGDKEGRKAFVDNFKRNPKQGDFGYEDMMQGLYEEVDGTLDVEENVKTAMAYAAYQWILKEANSPAWKTPEQMKEMHGKDKDSYISKEGRAKLYDISAFQHTVVDSLGSMAIQALGLKTRPEASPDMLARLKSAMGTHIMLELEKQGFIRREFAPLKEVNSFFIHENDKEARAANAKTDPKVMNSYVVFVRDAKDGKSLTPQVALMRAANKGSGSVLDRLFKAELAPRIPDTKPAPFNQKYASGTHQTITKKQRRVLKKDAETPHKVILTMLDMVKGMGDQAVLEIMGWRDLENGRIHAENLRSVEANNQNLENQYDLFMEMVDGKEIEEFYLNPEVWRNFRQGYTNQINPQTSKFFRFMTQRPGWEVEIDTTNPEHLNEFMISVGMNLGLVKTDQQPNAESLEKIKEKLQDPKIEEAVQAIQRNTLKDRDQDPKPWDNKDALAVRDVAKGEGMVALQALMAYAQYRHALDQGQTTFKTTLLVGADGKTNGPILTHLALGAASDLNEFYELLNRGGMYSTEEGQADHYSQYYQGGKAMDLYEDLSSKILAGVESVVAGSPDMARVYAALQIITKPLLKNGKTTSAGRNLVKTPLMAFAFGSALVGSIQSMENEFIESIYETIEGMADGSRKDTNPRDFIKALNHMIHAANPRAKLIPMMDIDALLEFPLGRDQENAIRVSFNQTIGASTEAVMKTYFATFIERRSAMNKTIQASYYVYETALKEAKTKEMSRLMEAGELAFRVDANGKQVPVQDLTEAQMNKVRESIKDLLPVMHTHYSLSENDLGSGLFMAKSEQKKIDSAIYKNKIHVQGAKDSTNKVKQHLYTQSLGRVEIDPGVAGTPYAIHSSDSSNIHQARDDVPNSLNVHDEISNSVLKIAEAARAINKATFKTFLEYSPAREAVNMLERQLVGMAQAVKSGQLDPATVSDMVNTLTEQYNKGKKPKYRIKPQEVVARLVSQGLDNAFMADSLRLKALAQMKSIDQYTWEGGQFYLEDSDRAEAQKLLDALPTGPSVELREAMEFLDSVYRSKPVRKTELVQDVVPTESSNEVADASPEAQSTTEMGVPGVLAHMVLEAVGDLAVEFQQAVEGGKSFIEALNEMVSDDVRARMIEVITKAGLKIPAGLKSPFGLLGPSNNNSDPALVEFFTKNPSPTIAQVSQMLAERLATGPQNRNTQFQQRLLAVIRRTADPSMKIVYVTPTTPMSAVVGKPDSRVKGWFTFGGSRDEIYVLSPEFETSGLSVELLLHEMTHGSLSRTIHAELEKKKANPKYQSETLELITELQDLQKLAQKHALKLPKEIQQMFAAPLNDIQEFVSWGMTNQEFQGLFLNQLEMAEIAWANRFKDGMKAFIDKIVGILFAGSKRTPEQIDRNGMTVLVRNVSALFAATAETQKGRVEDIIINAQEDTSLDHYTTQEVFTELDSGSLEPDFGEQLSNLLDGIVTKLHGPFGSLKNEMQRTAAGNALATWLKAMETGKAPFASRLAVAPFESSEQERFVGEQVEATVLAALNDNESLTKIAYRQLSDLFTEASKRVKPEHFHDGDWASADAYERELAQEKWNFIFRPEDTGEAKSDYLARFAAMGLTNQEFAKLLGFSTERDTRRIRDGKSIADKLQILLEKILEIFNGMVVKTYQGQPADSKLLTLVDRLVDIEAKRRAMLERRKAARNYVAPVEGVVKSMADSAREKIVKAGGADFVRKHSNGFVRGAGALARVMAGDRVDQLTETMLQLRNSQFKGIQGVAANLLTEFRGWNQVAQKLLRTAKWIEGQRKDIITRAAKFTLESFKDNGDYLSKQDKHAISAVFLRTGLHMLLDTYALPQMEQLVSDPKALNAAIKEHEAMVGQSGLKPYLNQIMINQAKSLGYYKARGLVKSAALMMNGHNISRMYGTQFAKEEAQQQAAQLEPVLDSLIALYALQYTPGQHKVRAREVFRTELARTDKGNGIEYLMLRVKRLEADALKNLFNGNRTQMMHGHTLEILNPHTEIQVANEDDGKLLIDRGWVRMGPVEKDPSDPEQGLKHMYVLKGAGLQPYQSGAFSLTDLHAKGTTIHNGFVNVQNQQGLANAQAQSSFDHGRAAFIKRLASKNFDPASVHETFAAPVVDEQGTVTNYRYLMRESVKDTVLERDNRFEQLMGALEGSMFDKQATADQNAQAVKALREIYDAQYGKDPDAFVTIGPDSADPELRQIWALMPEDTRAEIRRIWGTKSIRVRSDMLDIMFGYRKLSLSNMFKRVADERDRLRKMGNANAHREALKVLENNPVQQLTVGVIENLLTSYARTRGRSREEAERFAQRATVYIMRSERVWQEVVREIKDIIVVKTGIVLLGNMWSNTTLLTIEGVPIKDQIHHQLVALKGATTYREDSEEMARLQALLDSGLAGQDEADIRTQILRLKDSLARNPVRELIEAGLMPTIVDDVQLHDDPFTYKSWLTRKTETQVKKLPEFVQNAGKQLYMARDTWMYQSLSRTTQLSDFVARYTLVQHLTNRKDKPMSKADAIQHASDAFVNYDIPMHRKIQYLDDMGFLMFTKYFIRIQRVLMKLARENPARVLATIALQNFLDLGPIVLESSAIAKFGNNPWNWGALQFPSTLDELATVNSAMALMK